MFITAPGGRLARLWGAYAHLNERPLGAFGLCTNNMEYKTFLYTNKVQCGQSPAAGWCRKMGLTACLSQRQAIRDISAGRIRRLNQAVADQRRPIPGAV
jgi:hypothetical protein